MTKTPGEITLKGERFILLHGISPLSLPPVQQGEHHGKRQIVGTFAHLMVVMGGKRKREARRRRSWGGVRRGKTRRKGKRRGEEKKKESGGVEWSQGKDLLVLSKCP